jgi:hypothetical protein
LNGAMKMSTEGVGTGIVMKRPLHTIHRGLL